MSLRPSLSLVYGVRIPADDVDRVRALVTVDGELGDGLPLDARAATMFVDAVSLALQPATTAIRSLRPRVSYGPVSWWIVGRVS